MSQTANEWGEPTGLPLDRSFRPARANPDDPPVQPPPRGRHGLLPGPRYLSIPGRAAIVQAQVLLVALIVMVQLWLVTDALYELLSGRTRLLLWLAIASLLAFLLALVITLWPSRQLAEK
ncbi:hypothetical protein [Thermogemmatispora tikiterensis]|uniref:Uncharacterized protein n=1 Tax=Thermogemmatispora tikiterensis TaxID=1825093 RepID=A0A328VIT7_9CHLR|nr:hypothetical protein [Thermogemmatispora tikiterensis]RAQ94195.1 hypothetical protein A4R35_01530 [Thermogemmatispora tikiterensis]